MDNLRLGDFSLKLGKEEYRPIVIGGMGVDISTTELALEASRLGGIGHISDAMNLFVADRKFGSKFTHKKSEKYSSTVNSIDKSQVKFDLEDLYAAQFTHVSNTMSRKRGEGLVFLNIMEKLTMADPVETLRMRLTAALDAGVDGLTLSAGLHLGSLKLIEDHPRFRDVKIGIVVSSERALKIFLRAAAKSNRLPDYVIVEGPLAGGHLGFGPDWRSYNLKSIVTEILQFLAAQSIAIPVIPAGGIFTGTDAVEFMNLGAAAVQVATRFTVTKECGLPPHVKQEYFRSNEEDVIVSDVSPTGYPLRMLSNSPCLRSNVKPNCEAFGYALSREGKCSYIDAYDKTPCDERGRKLPVKEKICLCYHFSKFRCYTCGHYVYRLKDTSVKMDNAQYLILSAEHVFDDYLWSTNHSIKLPSH